MAKPGPNTVIIRRIENFEQIDLVLYAEIAPNIAGLGVATLANLAIRSATELADGRDGISYLIAAKAAGIVTPLSAAYESEIKSRMGAASLEEALRKAQEHRKV